MGTINNLQNEIEESVQLLIPDVAYCVHSDGKGTYSCDYCGHTWRKTKRYLNWPVSLHFQTRLGAWRSWFKTHGWQVGWDGIEQRVYGWTLHLGPLKVCFGSKDWAKSAKPQSMCCLSRNSA
jgi:hypothetical protein